MISTAEYQKKFGAATRSNKTKVAEPIQGSNSNAAVSPLLALDAKLLSQRYQAVFETYKASLLTY